jgi:hypothetical protein
MSNIVLRLVKGSPLTFQEEDDNFNNLNTDKIEQTNGTWTPINLSADPVTFVVAIGKWVKTGRLVTVTGFVVYPTTAGTAQGCIGGLPFTSLSNWSWCFPVTASNITPSGNVSCQLTNPSVSQIYFYDDGTTLTNADLSDGVLNFSGSYETDE